ncbi:glycosyltransferase family 2 protein [Streptomyces scabiei]|nr:MULTISPECIES: glycosyltransferase family 2 protein [Streptomyces]MDW8477001.1 glycosyltransferase family 2 protein [Streptomyces scabiei]MDX2532469.1 glycosyltransferase family 2 protein [Streptomyces scabiei]MDX2566657.1 glycosyltransferase family 2 protein [Streptomyces scabiei]MDX2579274.1 glycosyltransferase family 2 protein [Streptomyces scabiei]MDX2627772.1 glycosyltransferase family 2 protein [Streptomyces scabiei]
MQPTIACVVPCHNEEAAVGKVVRDLRMALPEADIYVYDNASTDRTVEVAREAGAIVREESRKGKGNVIRRAFADVDADALLLIDGDDTYDASRARELVNLLFEGPYDQVVGARRETVSAAYRVGHATGNRLLTGAVRFLFGNDVTDMLSGYRVFSRRFVKSFPALARQFETETEMTVHALHLRLPTAEVEVDYRVRPAGSESKLHTFRDGWRILRVILDLARRERPSLVHAVVAGILALVSVVLGVPVIAEFIRTGTVPRVPTAILAAAIMTIAVLVLLVGYILESLMHMRQEHSRLVHLAYAAPGRPPRATGHRLGVGPVPARNVSGAPRNQSFG